MVETTGEDKLADHKGHFQASQCLSTCPHAFSVLHLSSLGVHKHPTA
jgi:hypothetical protein